MTTKTNRFLAFTGLLLQTGIPLGIFFTLAGMFRTFGEMSGDTAQAAAAITGGVASALRATVIGQSTALVGLVLMGIPLFKGNYRAAWLYRWGRRAMFPWLLMIPVGTAIGIFMLSYFSKHRNEFFGQERQPDQLTGAGDATL